MPLGSLQLSSALWRSSGALSSNGATLQTVEKKFANGDTYSGSWAKGLVSRRDHDVKWQSCILVKLRDDTTRKYVAVRLAQVVLDPLLCLCIAAGRGGHVPVVRRQRVQGDMVGRSKTWGWSLCVADGRRFQGRVVEWLHARRRHAGGARRLQLSGGGGASALALWCLRFRWSCTQTSVAKVLRRRPCAVLVEGRVAG